MSRFDHLSERELQGPEYLQKILEVLDMEAGVLATTEKHRLVREALFEHTRQPEESIAQHVHRRHQTVHPGGERLSIIHYFGCSGHVA